MRLKTRPLTEQVALVTGGGTGIGRAFVEALAAAGVRVVIASRREEAIKRTAGELNRKVGAERIYTHPVNLRDLTQIDLLVNDVIERHQSLDVLINNSGLAVPETVD